MKLGDSPEALAASRSERPRVRRIPPSTAATEELIGADRRRRRRIPGALTLSRRIRATPARWVTSASE
jgi:hypothetical protein